jgi:hypothetical protein
MIKARNFFSKLVYLAVPFALIGSATAEPQTSPRRIALLVGINQYDNRNLQNLEYAERDVTELARILKDSYTVHLLLGSAPRAGDHSATKANLEQTIKKILASNLAKEDIVLLAFSGHGQQVSVKKNDGQTRDEPFYCPKDAVPGDPATMLNLSTLIEDLGIRGGGTNLLLVDACRNDPDPSRGRGIDGEVALNLPKGMAIFFSCSKGEKARETAKAGKGHGLFFHYVLEGLRSEKTRNGKGEVTWEQLVPYVKEKVQMEGPRLLGEAVSQSPHSVANLVLSPILLDAQSARLIVVPGKVHTLAGSYSGSYTFTPSTPGIGDQGGTLTLTISADGTVTGKARNATLDQPADVTGSVTEQGTLKVTIEFPRQSYTAKGVVAKSRTGHLTGRFTQYLGTDRLLGIVEFDLPPK